jgi:hypothetical protein
MIYKITEVVDDQTSTGKPMKRLAIEGVAKKLNIFSDFPHYADIKEGSTIDAEIRKNDKGYDNLYSNEIKPRNSAPSAFKQAQIEQTMARKETSIGKFQDNKEFSIMVASTMSGAVALACAEYKDKTVLDTLDQAVLKWRRFLLDNWSVDPKDIKPF